MPIRLINCRAFITGAVLLTGLPGCTVAVTRNNSATAPSSDAAVVRRIADEFAKGSNASGTQAWGVSSTQERLAAQKQQDDWAAALSRVDGDALYGTGASPSLDWRLYGTLKEAIEAGRALRVCEPHLWYIDQLNGWPAQAEYNAAVSPVATDSQRRALIASFEQLPKVAELNIADLREGMRRGYLAPKPNVDRVVAELASLLSDTTDENSLYSPAVRDTSTAFRKQWRAMIARSVIPTLRTFNDFLVTTYQPAARPTTSLAGLPNGAACYRAQVRALTTIDISPDSIVAIANRELPRIRERIRPLGEHVFGTTDVVAAMRHARTDSGLVIANPDSVLAEYRRFVSRARDPLPRFFSGIPDAPLSVGAVPKAQAAGAAPARYQQAPQGGGADAALLVNAYQPGGVARMNVAMGVVHEGYPGHHWQFVAAAAHASAGHPALAAAANSGYIEGWAVYAENLADEMGIYQSDLDKLGYLIHQYDIFTALQLDAGLHGLGWTRAQVVDSMMMVAGRPQRQAESYADRSAATPAQLASYAIGYIEINNLRKLAESRLGARFDIKAFHSAVLDDGPMPLAMLRVKIERWIAAQKA